jgi:glycosyltransferase involved in cell wall biosynthesis
MPGAERPRVSVIIPCREEERFIGRCLDSVLAGDYPQDRLEILVVDGMSTDRSRQIIAQYAVRYPFIRVVENPRRITPCAFNLGVREATGDIVMFMGAHATYSQNYVSKIVGWLETTEADSVGGVLVTLPADDSPTARAIACALSHPFGVGDSRFRIGTREPRWVDHVGFNNYRRTVFDRIGLFDEELVRNQDGEFNSRLRRNGGRVLLVPDVTAYYYARGTVRQVARMFFQYGYFKPLVARKIGRVMTLRQLAPPVLLLSLAGSGLASVWLPLARYAFLAIAASYLAAVLACSGAASLNNGMGIGVRLAGIFPTLHFSYGTGFLKRSLELALRPALRPRQTGSLPLSR